MSAGQRHHDLSNLRHLVDNNEEAVQRMVDIFCENTPEIVGDLNTQFEAGDNENLARAAHKLKSSIDLFQISELSESIRTIEKLALDNASPGEIKPLLDRLNTVIDEVIEDLCPGS